MKKTFYLCLLVIAALLKTSASNAQTINAANYYTFACDTTGIYISVSGCITGLTVKTFYGDGTSNIDPIFCSGSSGYNTLSHPYATSGTYTIKHVLFSGTAAIDSVTQTHTYHYCNNLRIAFYNDVNSNCINDAGDTWTGSYGTVRVDSAGVPVDTIALSYAAWYPAYGPAGTIYAFRVITPPAGLAYSCPVSGVIYDTIPMVSTDTVAMKYFGFECISTSGFDLSIHAGFTPALAGGAANKASVSVYNSYCTGTPATVKFEYSPKYSFGSISPAFSHTLSGTSVTVDVGTVASLTPKSFTVQLTPVTALTVGDTVNSKFTVSPISGDANPVNNIVIRCDTIRGSWDPNHKSVTPTGPIAAGTELEYMLEFENMGTDTAYNIHILDTISNNLDFATFKAGNSSHRVYVTRYTESGMNIIKFDFPNILLPDTTHHANEICKGMVIFSMKAKSTLAPGASIANRVGIYFDTNPAVMTNTVYSTVPFPTGLQNSHLMQVELYPNPVNNKFTLKTDGNEYKATLYNITGQAISTYNIMKNETQISTDQLAPGIYYVVLKGATASKAIKFEKQ